MIETRRQSSDDFREKAMPRLQIAMLVFGFVALPTLACERTPVASNQNKPGADAVAEKPPAPEKPVRKPVPNPKADNSKLAMAKIADLKNANDEQTRSRIARDLAEMSEKWSEEECSQVIDAVVKLGPDGKPLGRLLCKIIVDRHDPLRRRALEALERLCPELYEPVVMITVDTSASIRFEKYKAAAEKIVKLRDRAAVPIFLKFLQEGVQRAERGAAFSYFGQASVASIEALTKIAPDEPSTLEVLIQIVNTYATNLKSRNYRTDNRPVVVSAIQALGRFGPLAKGAIPALKRLKLDTDEVVRNAASESLKTIVETD
jgi:HEAT repeat protein